MTQFVSKQEALQCLKLSSTTLKKYRLQGLLIEGIHWVRINSRCIRYNLELIQDWLHNRHDPVAHQRAIHAYQASLLSNQKKSNRRAATKPK
jgi:tRNA(His) 5'-end guanylyltransferase